RRLHRALPDVTRTGTLVRDASAFAQPQQRQVRVRLRDTGRLGDLLAGHGRSKRLEDFLVALHDLVGSRTTASHRLGGLLRLGGLPDLWCGLVHLTLRSSTILSACTHCCTYCCTTS